MNAPVDSMYSTKWSVVLGLPDQEFNEVSQSLINVVNDYLIDQDTDVVYRIFEKNLTYENTSKIPLSWSFSECANLGDGKYLGASFQSGNRLFEFRIDPLTNNYCLSFKQLNVDNGIEGLTESKVLVTNDPTYNIRRTTLELTYNDRKQDQTIAPFRLILSRAVNKPNYFFKTEELSSASKTINPKELNNLLQETVRQGQIGLEETLNFKSRFSRDLNNLVSGFSKDSRLVVSRMFRRLIRGEVI